MSTTMITVNESWQVIYDPSTQGDFYGNIQKSTGNGLVMWVIGTTLPTFLALARQLEGCLNLMLISSLV